MPNSTRYVQSHEGNIHENICTRRNIDFKILPQEFPSWGIFAVGHSGLLCQAVRKGDPIF